MNEHEWTQQALKEIRENNQREKNAERRDRAEHKASPPRDDGKPKKVLGVIKNGKFEAWDRASDIFGFKV